MYGTLGIFSKWSGIFHRRSKTHIDSSTAYPVTYQPPTAYGNPDHYNAYANVARPAFPAGVQPPYLAGGPTGHMPMPMPQIANQ